MLGVVAGCDDRTSWLLRGLTNVVVDATHLPGTFQKDPADRFIVATARHHRLTLVTGDEAILAYARGGFVEVLAV